MVHCLAAADPAVPVTQVASHPQALSQCSQYLREKGLKPVEWSNTAAAARHVAQERPAGLGVLCSRAAAEQYGLAVLEEGVQNEKNNTTRFVVISREPILPEDANKISLCFSIPHTTGSLYHVLERFALCGLNLTKIESRPIPGRPLSTTSTWTSPGTSTRAAPWTCCAASRRSCPGSLSWATTASGKGRSPYFLKGRPV